MERSRAGVLLFTLLVGAVAGCRKESEPKGRDEHASRAGTGARDAGSTGGRGGAGSTAGQAGGGGEGGWLRDPTAWQSVATRPGCSTRVAADPGAIWPGLAFQSCGTGCREAPVMPGSERSLAAILGTSSRVAGGRLLLSLSTRVLGEKTTFVLGTYAFGDGKPVALVAEDGACFAQVAGRGSPQLLELFPLQGELTYELAWVDPASERSIVTWLPTPLNAQLEAFDFGTGWGGVSDFKRISVADSPTTLALTTVYDSPGIVRVPSGADGVAGFAEWAGGQGKILAYSRQSGVVTVASGDWYPARLGTAADRFVWLGATGERAGEGTYASARLYSCARPATLGPCVVEEGPSLPIVSSSGVLSLAGPWVALTGCSTTECDVYVVDRRDASVHRLRRAHADHGVEAIGISETELFVADYSAATRGTPDFDGLVRYDMSALADFATRL